jgi:hypothetical protein
MAKQEIWRFKITNRHTGRTVTVTVKAKRQADVVDALARLHAPVKTIDLVRHNGAGMVRRFHWSTSVGTVIGVRA